MFVASERFVDAAIAQANSLGFPDVARIFIPHPIQDRTDDEVRSYARGAFDAIVLTITAQH